MGGGPSAAKGREGGRARARATYERGVRSEESISTSVGGDSLSISPPACRALRSRTNKEKSQLSIHRGHEGLQLTLSAHASSRRRGTLGLATNDAMASGSSTPPTRSDVH